METNPFIAAKFVYKTYTCFSCNYKADVPGEIHKNYHGTYQTHVCLNCRILVDCCIENASHETTIENELEFTFTPCEPHCLNCDDSNLIEWNVEMCKCPKCENKMTITRLEHDGYQTSKIKII
jgi:hypothetical protein